MRERLAKDKGATYTYSMDYVSQTVSLVDEFRLREDQEVGAGMDGLDRRILPPRPAKRCCPAPPHAVRSCCIPRILCPIRHRVD